MGQDEYGGTVREWLFVLALAFLAQSLDACYRIQHRLINVPSVGDSYCTCDLAWCTHRGDMELCVYCAKCSADSCRACAERKPVPG